jgi:hypothetical protein
MLWHRVTFTGSQGIFFDFHNRSDYLKDLDAFIQQKVAFLMDMLNTQKYKEKFYLKLERN